MKSRFVFFGVLIALVLLYAGLCSRAGIWLTRDDKPEHADALVLLTGGIADRVLQVADLYGEGVAPRVIIVTEGMGAYRALNERGVEKYLLSEGLQSDGTRQITGLESAIYKALQKNALLIVDEIESSLHPQLVYFIVKKFLEQKDNRAQLLITTHYDPLLNEVDELFIKDSVWFTEKNEAGATELYSLVEFSGLNRISSLQKAYRQGRFGAIPKINL